MSTAVRISHRLIDEAKVVSKVENRSITGQIEYWESISDGIHTERFFLLRNI